MDLIFKLHVIMTIRIQTIITLIFSTLLLSCAQDDLLELEGEETSFIKSDLTASLNRSKTPCTFDLSKLPSNTTKSISCRMDLRGKTIKLASGINLEFDGGDIVNGTLYFNGGTIDGALMSSDLDIKGDVKLKNPIFEFYPSRWDIRQGSVNKAIAKTNKLNIREAIADTKRLGASTFLIGRMDAFLYVGNQYNNPNWYSAEEGISLPSNFTLKMSNNTHLRVYPNSHERYALIGLRGTSNSTVIGGNLYGDRDQHTYNGGTHEWGILVEIEGAQNSTIRNVHMKNASGDNMTIHSLKFTFQSDYRPAKNIVVDNCTFENSRRNNLSITDGQKLVIENSTFINAGVHTANSKGTNPRFAIDVEAHRERNSDGRIVYYEKVDGLIIRNNKEKGSARGGFLVSIGDNVILENNTVETSISYRYATGTIIRNNTMQSSKIGSGTALRGGVANTKTINNNRIYGNKIKGYDTGILLYGQDHNVYNNVIESCDKGFFIKDVKDTQIKGNTVTSSNKSSKGIYAHVTSLENVKFFSNKVTTAGSPFNFTYVNRRSSESNFKVILNDNVFNSSKYSSLVRAYNLTFNNNDINSSIRIDDSKNIKFYRNEIDGSGDYYHTLHFRGNSKNIDVYHNSLIAKKGKKNTHEDTSQTASEIGERGNTFRYQ